MTESLELIEEDVKEEELWDLDGTLTDYILPRIIAFRKMERHGYPSNSHFIAEYPSDMDLDTIAELEANPNEEKLAAAEACAIADWENALHKIEMAFTLMSKKESFERTETEQKKVQIGLELFAKHYEHLWD
tara:strand:+ start:379 stop:774 length:396 start_codon:yes stop_codon:yes gene_type:complete